MLRTPCSPQGDCYPLSVLGKVFSSLTMISGTVILALPITVVGSNFQTIVEMYEADSAAQLEAKALDENGDGQLDEMELREYLLEKRKDNMLRKGIDSNPKALLAKFDEEGKGWLSVDEFKQLQKEVIDPDASDPMKNMRILLSRTAEMEAKINAIETSVETRLSKIEAMLSEALSGPPRAAVQAKPPADGTFSPRLDDGNESTAGDAGAGAASPAVEKTSGSSNDAKGLGRLPTRSPGLNA